MDWPTCAESYKLYLSIELVSAKTKAKVLINKYRRFFGLKMANN